jgi:hypothetical protein
LRPFEDLVEGMLFVRSSVEYFDGGNRDKGMVHEGSGGGFIAAF